MAKSKKCFNCGARIRKFYGGMFCLPCADGLALQGAATIAKALGFYQLVALDALLMQGGWKLEELVNHVCELQESQDGFEQSEVDLNQIPACTERVQ